MVDRLVTHPVAEYAVAATGLSALFFAQEVTGTQSLFQVVSMGSVVAILLWMQHAREARQTSERIEEKKIGADRESRLLTRIEKLESGNDEKLLALIERQLHCAAKTDALLVRVDETLAKFNETISKFSAGRPCLMNQTIADEGPST